MGRIAYLMGSFPVWSETFIAQELKLLCAAGLDILPIAVRPGLGALPVDIPEPVYLNSETKPAASARVPRAGVIPAGRLRRHAVLARRAREVDALTAYLTDNGASHIHAAFADVPGLLSAKAARTAGIGYSISIHAHDVLVPKFDDGFLFGDAEFIAACNTFARDALVQRRPELQSRVKLIPHGIILADWPLRKSTFCAHDPLRFLSLGRLIPKKGMDTGIRLIAHLNRCGIDCTLEIVGEGPESERLAGIAGDEGVGDKVCRHEVVSRDRIPALMAEADILLVPSRRLEDGDADGIPNIIIEAMATGLLVLARDAGSIGEVVTSETGFRFDPEAPEACVNTIRALMGDTVSVSSRLTAAHAMVEQRFSAEALIEEKIALLRDFVT